VSNERASGLHVRTRVLTETGSTSDARMDEPGVDDNMGIDENERSWFVPDRPEDSENVPTDIQAAISGISMKPPAKRYMNSVRSSIIILIQAHIASIHLTGQPASHMDKISRRRISLDSLDSQVRFHLGHNGAPCPFPRQGHKDFLVIHTNGFHSMPVSFCGCGSTYEPYQQILDMAWFPATPLEPQTCATFDVLRQFHAMNLQGKLSGYDFYKSLVLLNDATGLKKVPDRLASFMLMARQWRHLKMSKRSGRGHDDKGIEATTRGGFAVECRACPIPSVNLPDGWESAPATKSWLYALILSQDANFRLKNRLRSTDAKDPSLQPGFAYFVSSDEYLRHLSNYIHKDEACFHISHCVGFAALWLANSKKSKGLRATGVASVSCARHQFFRPTGTGDMQIGERYANMDFLFISSLLCVFFPFLLLCYDIACQYSKNFWTRFEDVPSVIKFPGSPTIHWAVPKFHLPPHKPECHGPFALGYTPGVGRTDGEGVERNWAWLNGAAASTSQMGPGSRHDTLDDFMGFSNFRKVVDYVETRNLSGDSMLRNMAGAIPEAIIHHQAFAVFTESLKKEHEQEVKEWEKDVIAWETAKGRKASNKEKVPDPYLAHEDTVSVHEIERQLAEEEEKRTRHEANISETSPASFIISGLAIEDSQLLLRPEAAKRHQTTTQQASLQRKRAALMKKIRKFDEVLLKFLPGISTVDYSKPAENIRIHLPSKLTNDDRARVPILVTIEDRLREAHAIQALADLRRHLRTRTFARKFKDENARSQRAYTRMHALQDQIEVKLRTARDRYKAAREALFQLRGQGVWEERFRELNREDIRGLSDRMLTTEEADADRRARELAGLSLDDDDATIPTISVAYLQVGEGRRTLSWIWYGVTADDIDEDLDGSLHDGIRIEWLKARARAQRWKEEVMLLNEEMRRILRYTEWRAQWWDLQASRRPTSSPSLAEGLAAYAAEEAHIERSRLMQWKLKWEPIRQRASEAIQDTLATGSGELRGVFTHIEIEVDDDEDIGDEEDWSDDEN
ncbi:hypothetical protein H0H93_005636, partial [Arthromyces matolae]